MKANGPKRKIFDAVDMMTADVPQAETGNGLQSLPVDKIKLFHDHPFHLYQGERLDDMVESIREHGIRLSGPSLGRRSSDYDHDLKTQYIDNADRVEVERAFSLTKRSYGLGCITTRLAETTLGSIVLSVIAMNIGKIARLSFWPKFISIFSRYLAMWIRPLEPSADLQPAY